MGQIIKSGMNPTATHANGTCTYMWNGKMWQEVANEAEDGFSCVSSCASAVNMPPADPGWKVIMHADPHNP